MQRKIFSARSGLVKNTYLSLLILSVALSSVMFGLVKKTSAWSSVCYLKEGPNFYVPNNANVNNPYYVFSTQTGALRVSQDRVYAYVYMFCNGASPDFVTRIWGNSNPNLHIAEGCDTPPPPISDNNGSYQIYSYCITLSNLDSISDQQLNFTWILSGTFSTLSNDPSNGTVNGDNTPAYGFANPVLVGSGVTEPMFGLTLGLVRCKINSVTCSSDGTLAWSTNLDSCVRDEYYDESNTSNRSYITDGTFADGHASNTAPGTYVFIAYGTFDGNNYIPSDVAVVQCPIPPANIDATWQDTGTHSKTITPPASGSVTASFDISKIGPTWSSVTGITCVPDPGSYSGTVGVTCR